MSGEEKKKLLSLGQGGDTQLLNKIFTLLGHKKSCVLELIILSKDLAQIAEVVTMVLKKSAIGNLWRREHKRGSRSVIRREFFKITIV